MLATGGDCGCTESAAPFIIASDSDYCADESDVAALALQQALPLIMLKESTLDVRATVTIVIKVNRRRGSELYIRCIRKEETGRPTG